jgi:transforming growth factor-beta-induced protein
LFCKIIDFMGVKQIKREIILASMLVLMLIALTSVPVYAKPDHIVDVASANPDFSTLVAAVVAAELDDDLSGTGPFTVFAPTNDAFNALPPGVVTYLLTDAGKPALIEILTYHVVAGEYEASVLSDGMTLTTLQGGTLDVSISGSTVMINDAAVTAADIGADNGVIHVIDKVLVPILDIVDTAIVAGSFDTLVTALQLTGLDGALKVSGPFTVFAPTDDAFAALDPDTLAFLLDNLGKLAEILTYHVVSGEYMSGDVVAAGTLETLQGSNLIVTTNAGVWIDGAEIVVVDIECSNGVIHVIDAVMIPPPPFVIPEIPLGTILAAIAMFLALIGYVGIKRYRTK